jgi:inner membrane protein
VYATGHYGVALLVYAPVGGLLLQFDPELAVLGGVGVLSLARFPDIDLRLPLVPHRGPTHSLLFLGLVAGVLGGVGWLVGQGSWQPLGGPVRTAAFGVGVGVLGIGSHLLGDLITPAGVNVLWPLPRESVSLSLTRADNTVANWGLLALGVVATVVVLAIGGPG